MRNLRLEDLSVEQKIGQLLVVRRFADEEDRRFVYEMMEKHSVGGIQVACVPGCEQEIARIKEHADYPILICTDMEKGFPLSPYRFPSLMSLAVTGDRELAYQVGAVTAIEAKKCGYNTVWGPVVDMAIQNGQAHIPRVLGGDPQFVSEMAAAVLRGYYDNGMFASAKHWPGATDTVKDGHAFSNASQMTEEDILNFTIKPYLYLMEHEGLGGVMTGHTAYPRIDDTYPSSMSEKIVGILRKQGYDGLMFTDSFAMIGILQRFGEEVCYGRAIKAGNDMVLPNYRVPFKTSYEYMLRAYRNGIFDEDRLNEAVRRVLRAQSFTEKPATATEVSAYQKQCFDRIKADGIGAVTSDGAPLALARDKKKLFVVMTENLYMSDSGNPFEIGDDCGIDSRNLAAVKSCILERFPNSAILEINQFPSYQQVERVCTAATKAEEVVYITHCSSGAYRLGENLTERVVNLMESMSGKIAAICHLGNPYAMEQVPHVPRLLMSVGGREDAVERILAALNGEYEPKGKLPLKLQFK